MGDIVISIGFLDSVDKNKNKFDIDDRLLKIVTVGTGLIILLEKAVDYFPNLIIYFENGSRMRPGRYLSEFRATFELEEDDALWFQFVPYEVLTRIHFDFPANMPKEEKEEFLWHVTELEKLCIPDSL